MGLKPDVKRRQRCFVTFESKSVVTRSLAVPSYENGIPMGNYRGLIQMWSARALATIINDLINQLVRSYSVAKVADRESVGS